MSFAFHDRLLFLECKYIPTTSDNNHKDNYLFTEIIYSINEISTSNSTLKPIIEKKEFIIIPNLDEKQSKDSFEIVIKNFFDSLQEYLTSFSFYVIGINIKYILTILFETITIKNKKILIEYEHIVNLLKSRIFFSCHLKNEKVLKDFLQVKTTTKERGGLIIELLKQFWNQQQNKNTIILPSQKYGFWGSWREFQNWKDFSYGHSTTFILASLSKNQSISISLPDLLIIGRPGSGKLSRIRTFIKYFYQIEGKLSFQLTSLNLEIKEKNKKGKKRQKKTNDQMDQKINSSTEEIQIILSQKHIEINASLWKGIHQQEIFKALFHFIINTLSVPSIDSLFVETKTKNISKNLQPLSLTSNTEKRTSSSFVLPKVIVILHAELLDRSCQKSILRIIEENVKQLKIIFSATDNYSLLPALQSRCIQVSLASPNLMEIMQILKEEALYRDCEIVSLLKEGDDEQLRKQIALNCNRNLHQAIHIYYTSLTEYVRNSERTTPPEQKNNTIRETSYSRSKLIITPTLMINTPTWSWQIRYIVQDICNPATFQVQDILYFTKAFFRLVSRGLCPLFLLEKILFYVKLNPRSKQFSSQTWLHIFALMKKIFGSSDFNVETIVHLFLSLAQIIYLR